MIKYYKYISDNNNEKIYDDPYSIIDGRINVYLIWRDSNISFWRPHPPEGYVNVGDIMVNNMDISTNNKFLFIKKNKYVIESNNFKKITSLYDKRNNKTITIWGIIPPPNYVSLGYIVSVNNGLESKINYDIHIPYCIHKDLITVINSQNNEIRKLNNISLYSNSQFHTFGSDINIKYEILSYEKQKNKTDNSDKKCENKSYINSITPIILFFVLLIILGFGFIYYFIKKKITKETNTTTNTPINDTNRI